MKTFKFWENIPKGFCGKCYVEQQMAVVWFKNGKVHRDDGPAVVYDEEGENEQPFFEFWIEGKWFSDEDFWKSNVSSRAKLLRILDL